MSSKHKLKAVIFDLDGVITKTALVHSIAWKEMFDTYLRQREVEHREVFKEFTHEEDYLKFVDGKPRYEGVKSFLESRGIELPYGEPSDGVEVESYCGIGNRKNIVFNDILKRDGIEEYPSTVELIHRLKKEGIKVGVASSSKNCESVLTATGLIDLVETRVDGVVSAELGLKGKPAPDIFTTAADNLGVSYDEAVVVEDAISGVQAGKAGNFGLVLGLAREDNAAGLWEAGADLVVEDIEEIGFDGIMDWFNGGLEYDNWSLSYQDYQPEKERSREALLSVGNGFFGTRGAFEESEINRINYPGSYMAGVYNKLSSKVSGKDIWNEDFVNVSNWLPIRFRINQEDWIDLNKVKILRIRRNLDFRTGVLQKYVLLQDEQKRVTKVISHRFASMANKNIAAIEYAVTPVNYSATISLQSELRGNHINEGVERYSELNQQHLQFVSESAEGVYQHLLVKTTQSKIFILESARLNVMLNQQAIEVEFKSDCKEGIASSEFSHKMKQGDSLALQKIVFIDQSKEKFDGDLFQAVKDIPDFDHLLMASSKAWDGIWNAIDIKIEGDRLSQKLIRLHLYHLLSGTSPHNVDIDFSVPARGLTGEAYRGHIFWDELYILPVYFVQYPQVAKSILMYRYRRLNAAREYAKEFNYKGAMFPWQSGSDGTEETQKYHYNPLSGDWGDDHSSLQRHVSLAVAYNVIQYFHFTDDVEFMSEYGLEILLEIARFWASKSKLDKSSDRYSIDKVMGPDEFHESYPEVKEGGLKDNAYTNLMTVWMFNKIESILSSMDLQTIEKLSTKIKFDKAELENWKQIASKMNLVISDEGIISQYDGYFDLEELDWDYYREKYGNIHRMDRVLKAEGKTPDTYKVAKQADALMLFYNLNNEDVTRLVEGLGYKLPKDYVTKNLDYYLQRTSHGSTLSRVVHSYLARQIGLNDLSWEMFENALSSDFNDIQGGTTAEGIHTGVMAGTIWIVYAAFAGIDFSNDILNVNPKLPKLWRGLAFSLKFKGSIYKFQFANNKLIVNCNDDSVIMINNIEHQLQKGQDLSIDS